MSIWVTISDMRQYFDPAQAPPPSAEVDALLQAVIDRAEALVARELTGVVIEIPAPADLMQVVLELSFSIYLTRGSASLLETIGAEGQGGYSYVGQLNQRQRASLRQIRIEMGGIAV